MQSHFSHDDHDLFEIAVDEVGRGCLFGPVYVAAVVLPKRAPSLEEVAAATRFNVCDLKDSKKFTSKKKRSAVAAWIREHAVSYAITSESAETIDRVNILQATQLAMHAAIRNVLADLVSNGLLTESEMETRVLLLIDGSYFKPFTFVVPSNTSSAVRFAQLRHETVPQGDAAYRGIAAASILAKDARDHHMVELCDTRPELNERYGIGRNMGYGTADHMQGLRKYGIAAGSGGHRLSFSPCRAVASGGKMDTYVDDDEEEEEKVVATS